MKNLIISIFAGALALGGVANAAVVATGGTGSTGAGGFVLAGGGTIVDTNNALYFQGATTPASNWVWDAADSLTNTFEFSFSLAGFDPSSAVIDGLWGVDNFGEVYLNGNLIAELPAGTVNSFQVMHAFGASLDSLFNAGDNLLSFVIVNAGIANPDPAAFRAALTITADVMSPPNEIPVPAALPLFLAGAAAVGAVTRRRRRKQ